MRFVTTDITPLMAKEFLGKRGTNRKLRYSIVCRYAHDMETGRWKPQPDPISFNMAGVLINGQHRLSAVVKSKLTVTMVVAYDVPPEAEVAMDGGLNRSLVDVAEFYDITDISTRIASVANCMGRGMISMAAPIRTSRIEQLDFIRTHSRAISFGCEQLSPKTKSLTTAPTTAVFARASYTVDRSQLRRAAQILLTGLPSDGAIEPGDVSIVNLHRWLSQYTIGSGYRAQLAVYVKVERALSAFVAGESLRTIRAIKKEQFPLPEEIDTGILRKEAI